MTPLPYDLSKFEPYIIQHLFEKGIQCSTVWTEPDWCAIAPVWLDKLCGAGQVHFELIRANAKSNRIYWELHFEHKISLYLKNLDKIDMDAYLCSPACEALRCFLRNRLPNEDQDSSQSYYWHDWYSGQLSDDTLTKRALRFNTESITTVEDALQKFDEFYAFIRKNLYSDFGDYKKYFNVDFHELLALYR